MEAQSKIGKKNISNLNFEDVGHLLGYVNCNDLQLRNAFGIIQTLLKTRNWSELVGERYSWYFIKCLINLQLKKEFVHEVFNEIEHIENSGSHNSITKMQTQFNSDPLKGLWHKHLHLGNLKNIKFIVLDPLLRDKKINQLEHELRFLEKNKKRGETDLRVVSKLLKLHTLDYYSSLLNRGKLTGEWIVYHEFQGEKYYLGLWNHEDPDEDIAAKINSIFKLEFTEFKDSLPIFND